MTALPPETRSPREPEGPRRKHLAGAGHDAGWKGVVAGTVFGLAWVVWFAAGVWFLVLMSGSVMNRLDDSYLTRAPLRRRKK